MGVLADGPSDRWDEIGVVAVSLANPEDWLTATTADAVLGGANLAMIGGELIAFRNADAIGPGRFQLSGLLRGRFGTEFATSGHVVGDGFALLDTAKLFHADLGNVPLGTKLLIKAVGPIEVAAAVAAQSVVLGGANLRPFAPTHLGIARDTDGTLRLAWTRRSRVGLGWPDGTDTPLGEASEQYLVTLIPTSGPGHTYAAAQEGLVITPAQQIAQTGTLISGGQVSVAQVSATVGLGSTVDAKV